MSIPDFSDVIQNISGRLSVAADNASAEELAYLGAAVEKIAGKASALDLLKEAEAHKEAIELLAQSLTDDLNALKSSYQAQHVTAMNAFQNEAESISAEALTQFQQAVDNAVQSLSNAVVDASSMGETTHAKLFFYTHS